MWPTFDSSRRWRIRRPQLRRLRRPVGVVVAARAGADQGCVPGFDVAVVVVVEAGGG